MTVHQVRLHRFHDTRHMEVPTQEASCFCRSSLFDTMFYPDRNPRWIHAARAFGPLLVAGCLTVLMPSVSQFPPDSGLTDQNGLRSPEPISFLIATHAKHRSEERRVGKECRSRW